MFARGDVHDCRGRAWLLWGGACVVAVGKGMCGCGGALHRIRRDTVNERSVRILLECIQIRNIMIHLVNITLKNQSYFVNRNGIR